MDLPTVKSKISHSLWCFGPLQVLSSMDMWMDKYKIQLTNVNVLLIFIDELKDSEIQIACKIGQNRSSKELLRFTHRNLVASMAQHGISMACYSPICQYS